MARFQLREVVLLDCAYSFGSSEAASEDYAGEALTEAKAATEDESSSALAEKPQWPAEDVLKLSTSMQSHPEDYVLVLSGVLEDPRLDFTLSFSIGARFDAETEGELPPEEEVHGTLIFMTFPYVREFVASLTARSPTGPYQLPPRALPPDPRPR